MGLEKVKLLDNDYDKVNEIYDHFDEDDRLGTKAGKVEFLTTVRYIEKYLKPGMKILDLGAGTGIYSFYFANLGYDVTAIEITKKHVDIMRSKLTTDLSLHIIHGNALEEIPKLEQNYYDIILCFGPLYHINEERERRQCVEEMKSVCKENGLIYLAFINNDFIPTTETMCYDLDYLQSANMNPTTYKLEDFPFIFYKLDDIRRLVQDSELRICHEIASDGISELMQSRINQMNQLQYDNWLHYHYYTCERPEFIGSTNHYLIIVKKI